QLQNDGVDIAEQESIRDGTQGPEVRIAAGEQGVAHSGGEWEVVEERVAALPGEHRDPMAQIDDLSYGRVGRRDDPAGGGAVGGVRAGQLRYLHVLPALGVQREGEAPRDVLDEVPVEVELELVEGSVIPRTRVKTRVARELEGNACRVENV